MLLLVASGCAAPDLPEAGEAPSQSDGLAVVTCTSYTVTDLGILTGGNSSAGTSIAGSGLVAGTSQVNTTSGPQHAFSWTSAGGQQDLGTLGGQNSFGYAASGARIVGQANLASGSYHAFLYNGTTMSDLGTLGGTGIYDSSEARGVNVSGTVVGSSRLPSGFLHAVRWTGGVLQDLNTLPGDATTNSQAFGINDAGKIVGESDAGTGQAHAVMWSGGVVTDLGSLGFCGAGVGCSRASAINTAGDAVGYAYASASSRHPVKFHAGALVDLGLLAGSPSGAATGINTSGQIVGTNAGAQSGEVVGPSHGVLYQGGTVQALSDFVTASGWQVDGANGIDDGGRIVGYGHKPASMANPDGRTHALLLTPACASPAFRSVASTTNGTTVSKPSGVVAGDMLIAALEVDADPVTVTPPSGWTLVRNQLTGAGTSQAFHAVVYKHVATASEPAQYTFGVASGVYVDVQVAAYSGVSVVEASAGASATGTSITAPSLTTTQPSELLVVFYVDFAGGTWTTSSGLTSRSNFDSNSLQDALIAAAGPTGAHAASDGAGALAAISLTLK